MKLRFTPSQWERISEIFANLGLISVASIVIPYMFDKPNLEGVRLGMIGAVVAWTFSLWAAKKYK